MNPVAASTSRLNRIIGFNSSDTVDSRLHRLHKDLLRNKLLSTPVKKSRSGSLDGKQRLWCLLVIVVGIAAVVLRLLTIVSLIFFGDQDDFSSYSLHWYLELLSGNYYKSLGSIGSFTLNAAEMIGCLVVTLDRVLLFRGESNAILHHVYQLYPRKGLNSHLSEANQKSLNLMLFSIEKILHSTRYQSIPLYQMLMLSMCIMTNMKEKSIMFVIISVTRLIIDLFATHYTIMGHLQNLTMMMVSTKYLTLKLGKIKEKMQDCLTDHEKWDKLNVDRINRELIQVFKAIQQQNELRKYLLWNTMVVMSPAYSLVIYVLNANVPVWLTTLFLLGIGPSILLTQFSLYRSGNLLTVSRSLLPSLYSLQVRMQFHANTKFEARRRVRSMIKLVTSNRVPLSFTLPDTTPLASDTSLNFTASVISGTFLFLNNNLLSL